MRNLDSQLGSFGLEPPKVYRRDQRTSSSNASQQRRRAQNQPRAPHEKVKRQNKKRRLKKQVRRAIYGFALGVCIVAVIVVLSLTVLFKIDTINITGNEKYTTQQIAAVLPIQTEKNLFMVDTKGAKEKLEENLPYIYNAEIKRKFPSTIDVAITETSTVYYVKNADTTYTLMDDRLKVLEEHAAKAPKKAVEIRKAALNTAVAGKTAEFTNEKIQSNLLKISETVKNVNMKKVTAIYSQDINNNYIVFDGRITIKLGTLDKAEDKLYSALAAIDKLNQTNPKAEGEITATSDKQIYFTEK